MTSEEYWNGDCALVKYYRRADEMRLERKNQELWLQGMYVYEAICDASPIMHAFAKRGSKPHPYTDKPYPITEKQRKRNDKVEERVVYDKGKEFMKAFMKGHNRKYEGDTSQVNSDRR